MSLAIDAPTKAGHTWACNSCPYQTDDPDRATDHAARGRGGHMLYEVPTDARLGQTGWTSAAERVIYGTPDGVARVDRYSRIWDDTTKRKVMRLAGAVLAEAKAAAKWNPTA